MENKNLFECNWGSKEENGFITINGRKFKVLKEGEDFSKGKVSEEIERRQKINRKIRNKAILYEMQDGKTRQQALDHLDDIRQCADEHFIDSVCKGKYDNNDHYDDKYDIDPDVL